MASDVFVRLECRKCGLRLILQAISSLIILFILFYDTAADSSLSHRAKSKHNSDNSFVRQRATLPTDFNTLNNTFLAAVNSAIPFFKQHVRPTDIVVGDEDFELIENDNDEDDYFTGEKPFISTPSVLKPRIITSTTESPSFLMPFKRPPPSFYSTAANNADDDANHTVILYTSSSSTKSSGPPSEQQQQPPKRLTIDVGDRDRRAKLGGANHQERVDLNKCIVRGNRHPFELVRDFEWPRRLRVLIPGDIFIGGLHMIHEREDNCVCGPIMPQGGIQALEAMLYTLDHVNQQHGGSSSSSNLLPGFRLGALILDDCDKDTYGLEQSVEFIKGSISMIGKHGSSSNADQQNAWASALSPVCNNNNNNNNNPSTLSTMQQQLASVGGDINTPVISGVVGAPSSGTSKEVASLLRLFQIPQVSFFSTSPVLSNPERYKYFSRTIPSDKDQTRVMIQIIKTLGWSYISVIYEDSAYGNEAFDALEQLTRTHNICIAYKDRLPKDTRLGYTKQTYYNNIIEGLASKKARGVVVFGSDQEVRDLMAAIKANNLTNHFSFIGSDGWSMRPMVTVGLEDVVDGTLSVQPRAAPIPGFETYFRYLRPANNTRNPWFREYWEHMFECRFPSTDSSTSYVTPYNQAYERECTGTESYIDPITGIDRLQMEGQLQFVSDAVLAFAYAFRDLHRDLCLNGEGGLGTTTAASASKLCTAMNPPRGEDVLYVLRHVNFTSLTGMQFYFEDHESGDPPGRYNVVQFQRQRVKTTILDNVQPSVLKFIATASNSDKINEFQHLIRSSDAAGTAGVVSSGTETVGVWVHVGTYGPDVAGGIGFQLEMTKIRFRGDMDRKYPLVPESYCSKPCKPSQRRETKEGDLCCWVCIDCPEWAIRPRETECYTCPRGSIPYANFSYCLQVEAITIRIDSGEAIGALVFASFGLFATTFIIVIFVMHAETPVVKASGRELTYALLAGILLCYGMTFVLLQKPSDFVCGAQTFGIGFCFSICYAAILTKTNRIARIFRAGKRTTKRPAFISPRSQLVICLCGVLIQIVINGVWLVMDPPVATHIFPRHDLRMLVCKSHTDTSYMIAFAYPIVLVIICTVYAVLARKIPEAFNESKYIGFTMYTTCIIWLAFVPIYFSTKPNIQLRLTTLSIAISMSGTVSLACLFTPKLYIILLRPERNVRQSMMTQSRPTVSSGGQRSWTTAARPSNLSPQSSSIRQSSNSPQLQPLTAAAAAATAAAITAATTPTKKLPNSVAAVNAVANDIAKKMPSVSSKTESMEMHTRLNNKHSSFGALSHSSNNNNVINLPNSLATPTRVITTSIGNQLPNHTHTSTQPLPNVRENCNTVSTPNHIKTAEDRAKPKRNRKISAPATVTNDRHSAPVAETPLLQQNNRWSNHDRHQHRNYDHCPPHHHSRSHHSRHRHQNQQFERTVVTDEPNRRRYRPHPSVTVVKQHILPPSSSSSTPAKEKVSNYDTPNNKTNGNNKSRDLIIYEEGVMTASNPCICAHAAPSPKRRGVIETSSASPTTSASNGTGKKIVQKRSPPRAARPVAATLSVSTAMASESSDGDEDQYLHDYEEDGESEEDESSAEDVRL